MNKEHGVKGFVEFKCKFIQIVSSREVLMRLSRVLGEGGVLS